MVDNRVSGMCVKIEVCEKSESSSGSKISKILFIAVTFWDTMLGDPIIKC
jgi:hypothetical protein